MLKIQEELGLRDTAFYREAFEEGRLEGREEGILKGKLDTVPLLRELGLSDKQIAEWLNLPLAEVQRVAQA